MTRILSLLLVAAGISLIAQPAQAAYQVSLSASRATIFEGSSTTLSGRASGAKLGSVVRLERKAGDRWAVAAERRLRDTRDFSFVVRPNRGYQSYRVVKPRQFGQPREVSRTVSVTVKWRPDIAVSASGTYNAADDAWVTTVAGMAREIPSVTLSVQSFADGSWDSTGESVVVREDGGFSHTIIGGERGTTYRFASPAKGVRVAAWSDSVVVTDEVRTPEISFRVTTELAATQTPWNLTRYDQEVRAAGTTEPGAAVDIEFFDSAVDAWGRIRRVSAAADGTFDVLLPNFPEGSRLRARVVEDGPRKTAVSNEVVTALAPIPITVDGPEIDVFDIAPGQGHGALLRFDAVGGELLSVDVSDANSDTGGWVNWRVFGPDGVEVPQQRYIRGDANAPEVTPYYVPSVTGTHTLLLSSRDEQWSHDGDDARVTLSSPLEVNFDFDTRRRVVSHRPWQVIDLKMTGAAGQAFSVDPIDFEQRCPTAQVIQGGQVVPHRFPDTWTYRFAGSWVLPADGAFVVRLWPCERTGRGPWPGHVGMEHTLSVLRAASRTVPLDGSSTRIDQSYAQYGVGELTTTAGKIITLTRENWYFVTETLVEAPDGEIVTVRGTGEDYVVEFTADQSGTYRLWSAPPFTGDPDRGTGYIVWSATERDP